MSHHKITNVFQSEKRPDFDVKILRNDSFLTNVWYIGWIKTGLKLEKCFFHFMGTLRSLLQYFTDLAKI